MITASQPDTTNDADDNFDTGQASGVDTAMLMAIAMKTMRTTAWNQLGLANLARRAT